MSQIHASAIVDPRAELAEGVAIGPYTIIGPHVKIGQGTAIASHCVIENRVTIGAFNKIGSHCTLGQNPQDLKFHGEPAELVIGDHNDIREHVSMQIGTENGGMFTKVGSHNLVMIFNHIAHDTLVGSHCILANGILMAGHGVIEDFAVISGGAAIHHFVTIGRYAFVGGVARITHDCPPYMITEGNPARVRGVNAIGLARRQFDPATIDRLKHAYFWLFKREQGTTQQEALAELEARHGADAAIGELIAFVRRSAAGVHGRYAESLRKDNKRANSPR